MGSPAISQTQHSIAAPILLIFNSSHHRILSPFMLLFRSSTCFGKRHSRAMAVKSKDIETLWKDYSEVGVNKGISVTQFFESNGVPYRTFEIGIFRVP